MCLQYTYVLYIHAVYIYVHTCTYTSRLNSYFFIGKRAVQVVYVKEVHMCTPTFTYMSPILGKGTFPHNYKFRAVRHFRSTFWQNLFFCLLTRVRHRSVAPRACCASSNTHSSLFRYITLSEIFMTLYF